MSLRTGRMLVLAATLIGALSVPGAGAQTVVTTRPFERTIVMTGEGEVKVMPDEAMVSGGAVTEARTASEAVAQNAAIMSRVFAAVQALGIPKTAIATYGFSLEPQYPPTDVKNPQPHVIAGYEVRNGITVTLDDVEKAGAVLDALIDSGANESAGVSFDIKNPKPLMDQARALAGHDALVRAQIYARAVGAELGPVRSISEGYGRAEPSGTVETVVVTGARAATPISAGEQGISASVTIMWTIK